MEKKIESTNTKSTDKKLIISDVIVRLLRDYKKSINWFAVMVYYIGFTIAVLLDGCTLNRFLGVTVAFVIITLFAWVKSKVDYK